jgi:hypothetical protein
MKKYWLLTLLAALAMSVLLTACKESTTATVTLQLFEPKGTIQGRLTDITTGRPIVGAKVCVAYNGNIHVFRTGETGEYSFSDVPVNEASDQKFSVVVDNRDVTAPAAASAFPEYVYGTASMPVSDYIHDTNCGSIATSDLTAQLDFEYGQLVGTATGTVRQYENFNIIPGTITVTIQEGVLYAGGTEMGKVEGNNAYDGSIYVSFDAYNSVCNANGQFTFSNLPEGMFYFLTFQAAGYETHEAGFWQMPGQTIQLPRDFVMETPAWNSPGSYFGIANDEDYVLMYVQVPDVDATHPVCTSFTSSAGNVFDRSRYLPSTITSFTFTFNEAMDNGSPAMLRVDGFGGDWNITYNLDYDIDFGYTSYATFTWDSTCKVLTVSNLDLKPGYAYTIDLTMLRDNAGNYYTGTFSGNFSGTHGTDYEEESVEDGDKLGYFPQAALRFMTAKSVDVTMVLNVQQVPDSTDYNDSNVDLVWDQSSNCRSYIVQTRYLAGPWIDIDYFDFTLTPTHAWSMSNVNDLSRDAGGPLYDNVRDYKNNYASVNGYDGEPAFDFSDGVNATAPATVLEFRIIPIDLNGIPQYAAASAAFAPVDNVAPQIIYMNVGDRDGNHDRNYATAVFNEPMLGSDLITTTFSWVNGLINNGSATSVETPTIAQIIPRLNGTNTGGAGDQTDEVTNETVADLTVQWGDGSYVYNAVEVRFANTNYTTNLSRLDTFDYITTTATDPALNTLVPPVADNVDRVAYVDYLVDNIVPYIVSPTLTTTNPAAGNNDSLTITFSEEVVAGAGPWFFGTDDNMSAIMTAWYINTASYSETIQFLVYEYEALTQDAVYVLALDSAQFTDRAVWSLAAAYAIDPELLEFRFVRGAATITTLHLNTTIPQE